VKALGDESLTRRILDDPDSAPDPRLRAALGLIRKLSLAPETVGPPDVRALLELGVTRQGVADVVYVCFLFATYTRLSDTLGWEVPEDAAFVAGARILLKRGYL
jgi:hypothetical protein